ncbi:hypothetical protein DL95DRAFT_470761 [Leptodontidium sp. 2 PMI_412]|nr:hypothetical protein DL95DRAFT_470761 [Leptodontidium sp. 2 PMI_412]
MVRETRASTSAGSDVDMEKINAPPGKRAITKPAKPPKTILKKPVAKARAKANRPPTKTTTPPTPGPSKQPEIYDISSVTASSPAITPKAKRFRDREEDDFDPNIEGARKHGITITLEPFISNTAAALGMTCLHMMDINNKEENEFHYIWQKVEKKMVDPWAENRSIPRMDYPVRLYCQVFLGSPSHMNTLKLQVSSSEEWKEVLSVLRQRKYHGKNKEAEAVYIKAFFKAFGRDSTPCQGRARARSKTHELDRSQGRKKSLRAQEAKYKKSLGHDWLAH